MARMSYQAGFNKERPVGAQCVIELLAEILDSDSSGALNTHATAKSNPVDDWHADVSQGFSYLPPVNPLLCQLYLHTTTQSRCEYVSLLVTFTYLLRQH